MPRTTLPWPTRMWRRARVVLEESEDDNDVPVTVDDADEKNQVDNLA